MHIGQFGHHHGHGVRPDSRVEGHREHGHSSKSHRARSPMQFGLSGFGRGSAMKLLTQNLFASLNRSLQVNMSVAVSGYPAASSSPQDVAGQVSRALQELISQQPAAEESPEQTIETAKASVAEGLAETEQQIAGQNNLTDGVQGDLNTTGALLDDALGNLNTVPVGTVETNVVQYSASRSTNISITTNDGDIVTISISAESGGERSSLKVDGEGIAVDASSSSRYASSSLTYTVEGELDKGERKSIRKLMNRIEHAADKFFDGRTHKALHKLGKMKLDTRELQGFSVEMSRSASVDITRLYQANMAAPQAVEESESMDGAESGLPPAIISTSEMFALNAMVNEFVSISKSQPDADLLTDPAESIAQLAGTLLAAKAADNDPEFEDGLDAAEKLIADQIEEHED